MAREFSPLNPNSLRGREIVLLLFLTLLVNCFLVVLQPVPGYMDAAYYYATGIQLAEGNGFTEPFLWNYLEGTQSLPHPSHSYWYPLASLVAALGMRLTGSIDFLSARIGFFLISLLVPQAVARLALRLTGRRDLAWVAGFLAIFCGYYLPFLLTTDNYAIYLLIGAIYFYFLEDMNSTKAYILGCLAGLLNLARADGLLWLPLSLAAVTYFGLKNHDKSSSLRRFRWRESMLVIVGYLTTFGFWIGRNLVVYGAPSAPGSSHVLWMTNYSQLFSFTPGMYTFQSWLSQGWMKILSDRVDALWTNLGTGIMAQGVVFLSPFILVGLWSMRKKASIRLAVIGWLLLLFSESVFFPYASVRGGFFHAGTAFQPIWFAVVPFGIERVGGWILRGRFKRVQKIFLQAIVVVLVGVLSIQLVKLRVIDSGWNEGEYRYEKIEQIILAYGAGEGDVIAVVNPPAYNAMTGRRAIVIPEGGISTLLEAARQFNARYIALEEDRAPGLFKSLGENLQLYPELVDIGGFDLVRIYAIRAPE